MLIGIPAIIGPELLDVLMRMGHGDEIVLADANFPADSVAANLVHRSVVPVSGAGTVELLKAVLRLMPLDTSVEQPALFMGPPMELGEQPVHADMLCALNGAGYSASHMRSLTRFDFYERAKRAYAVAQTSEMARFGNIIVKKGTLSIQR
jgi:L-fucose mutarotase